MVKNVIELIQERKIDVTNLQNAAEIYLMVSMKNLDFHTDLNTSFTELDPPEHQEFLKLTMMICQNQIQNTKGVETVNTIEGNSRNVEQKGLCFEKKAFGKHIQIPLDFIKRLGFFDIRQEGSKVYLDIIHLSFMEFSCAGSLCREEVNIEQELLKIKDDDRFEAVTNFLAGLFSQNPAIQFYTTVRNIAENFLLLLGNEKREVCLQIVYRSILNRSSLHESNQKIDMSLEDEIGVATTFTLQGTRHIRLLVEALKASSDEILPFPAVEINISDAENKSDVEIVTQLLQLQKCHVANLTIRTIESHFALDYSLSSLLSIPAIAEKWTVNMLKLPDHMGPEGWNHLLKVAEKGHIRSISLNDVVLRPTQGEIPAWCALLGSASEWRIERLLLPENMQPEDWNALKKIADKGEVDIVIMSESTLRSANDIHLQALWKATRGKIGCWWDCTNNRKFAMTADEAGIRVNDKVISINNGVTCANADHFDPMYYHPSLH